MGDFEDIAELETNLAVEELGFRAPRIGRKYRPRRVLGPQDQGSIGERGAEARRASCVKITMPKINLDDC